MQNLYVIGNGFDLHHKIKSSYAEFGNYLHGVNRNLFNLVSKFLPVSGDWTNLESSFPYLQIEDIYNVANIYLVSYGDDDFGEDCHGNYRYEVDKIFHGLSVDLYEFFVRWVSSLSVYNSDDLIKMEVDLLGLPKDAIYLNFNYTCSLQVIYGIPDERIFYIHGSIEGSDIVMGHNTPLQKIDLPAELVGDDSEDIRTDGDRESMGEYISNTFKNVEEIASNNHVFFDGLKSVSKVFVLGHSLSDVDRFYFERIAQSVNSDEVNWVVTFFNERNLSGHRIFFEKLGVSSKNITFCKMKDIHQPVNESWS